jgi:hypothetical protein
MKSISRLRVSSCARRAEINITVISLSVLRFPAVSLLSVTPVDTSKHELERKEQQPEELPVPGVAKCDRDGKAEHGHIGQAGFHRRSTLAGSCGNAQMGPGPYSQRKCEHACPVAAVGRTA